MDMVILFLINYYKSFKITGFPLFGANKIADLFNFFKTLFHDFPDLKSGNLTICFCVIEYSVHFSFSNQLIYCQIFKQHFIKDTSKLQCKYTCTLTFAIIIVGRLRILLSIFYFR